VERIRGGDTYGLVRSLDGDVQVLGLGGREDGQLDVELGEMGAGDLLVELLGKHVDAEGELLRGGPEGDLGKDLVGERARHHEGRVASGTTGNKKKISIQQAKSGCKYLRTPS
jgi:hypothetical protein